MARQACQNGPLGKTPCCSGQTASGQDGRRKKRDQEVREAEGAVLEGEAEVVKRKEAEREKRGRAQRRLQC